MNIFHLIVQGDAARVKKLLEKSGEEKDVETILSSRGTFEQTPLLRAAVLGETAMVELFLSYKVDINAHDEWKNTALILAARKGHLDVVLCLIKNGADINACNQLRFSALIVAAAEGHLDVVLCLVKYGADIEAKEDQFRSTALNWAAWKLHVGVVKGLVEAGAVIDAPNRWGSTALELTITLNNESAQGLEIAEELLKAGSDVSICQRECLSSSKWIQDHFSTAILLLQYGGTANKKLFNLIGETMGPEKMKQLCSASVDGQKKRKQENSPSVDKVNNSNPFSFPFL